MNTNQQKETPATKNNVPAQRKERSQNRDFRGRSGGHKKTYSGSDQNRRRSSHSSAGRSFSRGARSSRGENSKPLPPILGDNVRIIPLGGVEEVGKNMCLVENENDAFVIDAGFQFSEAETPGIDYIIPNTKYLEERKHKIRGVLITHGHLDHIGGIPFVMEKLGNPPIYTRTLTSLMIKKRQEEFPEAPKLNFTLVEPGQKLTIGKTKVKFFAVTHSIPDSMGVSIETPHGNVLLSGDLKLNHVNGVPTEEEEEVFTSLGKDKNLLLIADSTNAENPGWSVPESRIYETIEEIIKTSSGRLIIGTFASQFARMIKIIELCEKYGKKVAPEGRSIKSNIQIAERAGLLAPQKGTMISSHEIGNHPADRVVVIATGAQGEEFAALMRMARGEHRQVTLSERDTILLSSSVIPGNELSVQALKDALYRHRLKIIHYRTSDVHASGHGNQEELAWINQRIGAKFFMPAYGYHSMLRVHAEVAERSGVPRENIIVADNGNVIDIEGGEKVNIHPEKAPAWDIFVDGFSVGDMQDLVIRDRTMLASDGMFIVVIMMDQRTKKVKKSPDVISRGFVYLKENQDLLNQARGIARKTIEDRAQSMSSINFDALKRDVTETLSRFLLQKTNKRPMVLPVILSV